MITFAWGYEMAVSNVSTTALTTTTAVKSVMASTTTTVTSSATSPKSGAVVSISTAAKALAAAATQTYTISAAVAAFKAGTLTSAVKIVDASTSIATNLPDLAGMAHANMISNITFNNASPGVSIDRSKITGTLDDTVLLLKKINTTYNLTLQQLSVAEATTINTLGGSAKATFTVKDDAQNITAGLATLQTMASSKKLTALAINDQTANQKKQMVFDAVTATGRNPVPDPSYLPAQISALPNLLSTSAAQLGTAKTALALLSPKSFSLVVTAQDSNAFSLNANDSRIAILLTKDTSVNLNKNMNSLVNASKTKIIYFNPSDNKPVSMSEDQLKAFMNTTDGFNFGCPDQQIIDITNVKSTDVAYLKNYIDRTGRLKTGKISVADTLPNILTNLDALETAVKSGIVTNINVTGASTGSISISQFNADLDALKLITSNFTLGVTGLAAADAKAVTSPSKYAKLNLTVSDTAANIVTNIANLQVLAKAKTLTAITNSDAKSFMLNKAQFDASPDLLKLAPTDYRLFLTNMSVADAAKVASNAHLFRMSISDSTANILKGWSTIQSLSDNRKITGLTCTDTTSVTLNIADAYKINSIYQAALPATYAIADTAKQIINQKNLDLGSILANTTSVSLTDKTPPSILISQATTLKSIPTLAATTKYSIVDSAVNITAATGQLVLTGAQSVKTVEAVTIEQAKALLAQNSNPAFAISDTADALITEGTQGGGGILAKASYVNLNDSTYNMGINYDALKSLSDRGYLSTSNPNLSDKIPITAQQVFSSYQLLSSAPNVSSVIQPYAKSALIDEQSGSVFYRFNNPYLALGTGFAYSYSRSSETGATHDGYLNVTGSEPGYFSLQMNFGSDATKKATTLSIIDKLQSATSITDFTTALNLAKSSNLGLQMNYEITSPIDDNGDGVPDIYSHVQLDTSSLVGKNGTITLNPQKQTYVDVLLEQKFLGHPTGNTSFYFENGGAMGDKQYNVTGKEQGIIDLVIQIKTGNALSSHVSKLLSAVTSAPTPQAFQDAWNALKSQSAAEQFWMVAKFIPSSNVDVPGQGSQAIRWDLDFLDGHAVLKS